MSRKIDFSKALSEEDEQYVADRPWLREDAVLSGFEVESGEFVVVDPEEPEDPDDPEGFENDPGDPGDESDESVVPYSEWEYQELKDEAKRRELPAGGSKEQLIKRLEENDSEESE